MSPSATSGNQQSNRLVMQGFCFSYRQRDSQLKSRISWKLANSTSRLQDLRCQFLLYKLFPTIPQMRNPAILLARHLLRGLRSNSTCRVRYLTSPPTCSVRRVIFPKDDETLS